ncbi:uncharacterized protein LOC124913654 [Impatiens glandulifera]|uniref:uncharacterized protein LOC124913654 n=1 Tax=Impatiens glandulifera TaxID=253017 RepID=UPI001FB0FA79|nr:uncharacterized protein LOC124913654 [Impatiens glandulifera]
MSSCSIFGSNVVALATAMVALSGTVIFLAFCRENNQILGTVDSPPQKNQTLRSCLSSSSSAAKQKKKKRVRFADEDDDDGEYRKGKRESVERRIRRRSCRAELISRGMQANRGALYSSMMKDRVNRMLLIQN